MRRGGERSQSEVLGVILLLGLSLASITAVLVFGMTALEDTRSQANVEGTSQSLTQFASETSLVAHGESDAQTVELAGADDGVRSIDENAGNLSVYVDGTHEAQVRMGKIVYEKDGDEIAYQGGGVWKKEEGGATMVSSPEFHYRVDPGGTPTLTLPLVAVRGDHIDSSVRVARDGETQNLLSDIRVDSGTVKVEVQSEYYEAWGRFFETRTTGEVEYDHDAGNATITLKAPAEGGQAAAPIINDGDSGVMGSGAAGIDGFSGNSYAGSTSGNLDPNDENTSVRTDGDLTIDNNPRIWADVHVNGDLTDGGGGQKYVYGDTYVSGDATIDDLRTLGGDVHVGGELKLVFGGAGEFDGDHIAANSVDDIDIDSAESINVVNDVNGNIVLNDLNGDLVIGGDWTMGNSDDLGGAVDGDIAVRGNLILDHNNAEIRPAGDLVVDNLQINQGTVVVGGSTHAHDDFTIEDQDYGSSVVADGDVHVTEDFTGDIVAENHVTIDSNVEVDGNVEAGGNILCDNNADITGDATAGGTIDGDCNVAGSEFQNVSPAPSASPRDLTPQSPTAPEVSIPEQVDVEDEVDSREDENDNDETAFVDTNDNQNTQTISTAGEFYLDDDLTGNVNIDTTDGDIQLFVDGNVDVSSIDHTGDNRVNIYATGSSHSVSDVTRSGDDRGDLFWLYVDNESAVDVSGSGDAFQGVIYGPGDTDPGADITVNTQHNIYGALIGDVEFNSNALIHYDKNLSLANALNNDGELEEPEIAYLHISRTVVYVD